MRRIREREACGLCVTMPRTFLRCYRSPDFSRRAVGFPIRPAWRAERGRSAPGRRRARACGRSGEGAVGPEAAQAVCKRIRHAVKPFAQGSWRGRRAPNGRAPC
jgi:hypothetical protein